MKRFIDKHPVLRRLVYFFPVQLLLVQLKKNHLILLFWLLLFGFITQVMATRYGVGYLFVDPEYMDEVGFLSYFIVGFSCGGFIMAYNISCYIQNAYRFPFLATLSHPFIKFCHNNFIIPLAFLTVYVCEIVSFLGKESVPAGEQLLFVFAFVSGVCIFISMGFLYFIYTNKDISKLYGVKCEGEESPGKRRRVRRLVLRRDKSWKNIDLTREARDWHIETYMAFPFRIRLARSFDHYDKEMLIHVFRQNHNNAVFFEALVLITLLLLGSFRDVPVFMIPAGASIFLLFTLYLVMSAVLYTWFRGWSNAVFFGLFVLFNWAHQYDLLSNQTRAYGMDYTAAPVEYSNERLHYYDTVRSWRNEDSLSTIAMLERWKAKNSGGDSAFKPKLVIFNCSGGGLRSSLWSLYTLQQGDSATGKKLLSHTAAIFGSSGGMLGAAYLREQLLRQQEGEPVRYDDPELREHISTDILNPMAFSIAVNDWFLPFQKFEVEGQKFSKNRAYAFEQKFHENTLHSLDKSLSDYKLPEAEAKIPMMVFSPTVVNDGRRLVISAQGVSYLTQSLPGGRIGYNKLPDGIEFSRFFKDQGADKVRFSSVLRMNATFPYVTPITALPSTPQVEVFDAGMRDNYGLVNALRFLYVFRNWIEANTSGVVILQTRDKSKEQAVEPQESNTIMRALGRPMSSFYGNLFVVQDYNVDRELEYAGQWCRTRIDVLDFELQNESPDRISLSWHLTKREKAKVIASMKAAGNMKALKRLQELMSEEMPVTPLNAQAGKAGDDAVNN